MTRCHGIGQGHEPIGCGIGHGGRLRIVEREIEFGFGRIGAGGEGFEAVAAGGQGSQSGIQSQRRTGFGIERQRLHQLGRGFILRCFRSGTGHTGRVGMVAAGQQAQRSDSGQRLAGGIGAQ